MTKAVTYAEIDLPRCGLTYGIEPCRARKIGDNLGTGYSEYFNGTAGGWVAVNATLTPALGGLLWESTGTDPRISVAIATPFSGADNQYVTIEATRLTPMSGTWDGKLFYGIVSGHGESGSFYKQITEQFAVGVRTTVTLDMHDLTAGGTDWSTNSINLLRLDLDQTTGNNFKVHSVRAGPLADATTATGATKCFNTLATCQDVVHYDTEERPSQVGVPLGIKIESHKTNPVSDNFNLTGRALGAVAGEGETRKYIASINWYRSAGVATLTLATVAGLPCIIRGQIDSSTVGTAIIECDDPVVTMGTIHLEFSAAIDQLGLTSYRVINGIYKEVDSDITLPSPGGSLSIAESNWMLGSVTSQLMSTSAWTGILEDTDDSTGSFRFSSGSFQYADVPSDAAYGIDVVQTYEPRTAPTFIQGVEGAVSNTPIIASQGGLQVNDIAVIILSTTSTSTVSTPAGWERLGGVTAVGIIKTDIYWQRLTGTSYSASFNPDSNQRLMATTVVIRGVDPTLAAPLTLGETSFSGLTSVSIPSVNAPVDNCFVIDVVTRNLDAAGAFASGWTNANLSGMTERSDWGTTTNSGGGHAVNTGVKATAGATGATDVTLSASSSGSIHKIVVAPTDNYDSKIALQVASYEWVPPRIGTEATLRFGMDTGFNSKDIDSINCIEQFNHTPTVVSLGEDLGTREAVSFTMTDVKHPDTGPAMDKYWAERGYDPYERGTFWPRLLARYPYFGGRTLRWYEGDADQELSEMTQRYLLIESISGPDQLGGVTLTAKDPLKMADSDKALAPRPSLGYLLNDITDVATSATLSPSGIGEVDYPTSGLAAIAGNELVTFTRSGDDLTIVREQEGTPKSAHTQQDHFQIALEYDGMDPADIIYDLLVTYAGIDPTWINLDDWHSETEAYLRRVYSAIIGEPTPVRKIIAELIQAAGLAVWWDSELQRIRLIVLREVPSDAVIIDNTVRLESRPNPRYQPEKRTSQVLVHFAMKDPLKSATDPNNFRQRARVISAESELNYGTSAIKTVFARFIPPFARTTAIRVGDLNIGRFQNAPRRLTFDLFRDGPVKPVVGGAYRLTADNLQLADGSLDEIPIQMTSIKVERDRWRCEAEEMRFTSFDAEDLVNRVITIDGTNYNLNLRDIHDDIYPPLQEDNTITFIFATTSKTGSNSDTIPAVDCGDWPATFVPHVEVRGKIQAKGGTGGNGANDGGNSGSGNKNGHKGGTALLVRAGSPITLTDTTGQLIGGGGGGAGGSCANFEDHRGGGGGGGAGFQGGDAGLGPQQGEEGKVGTETAGGAGGRSYTSSTFWTGPSLKSNVRGGDGGAPGTAGNDDVNDYDIPGGSPGAAGNSIEGIAYVTTIGTAGTRIGPQV